MGCPGAAEELGKMGNASPDRRDEDDLDPELMMRA
jgi:hypothetical protein